MKEVKKLAVIGAGTMGGGIAQVAAMHGILVTLLDVNEKALRAGMDKIVKSLRLLRDRNKITELQERSALANITEAPDFAIALNDIDMAIEAVPEEIGLKRGVFKKFDELCGKDVILGSCTSGISITALASSTKRRDKVIGMHFTNPVPLMKGVSVIVGLETSEETLEATKNFLSLIGKEYWVTKDSPGFAGTRIMCMYINEAFNVLQEGIASAEDIDKEFKLVLGHPLGPLELADFAGLDVILNSSEYICAERGEKYRPSPLLKQLVLAGYFGKKSGRGVYKYK